MKKVFLLAIISVILIIVLRIVIVSKKDELSKLDLYIKWDDLGIIEKDKEIIICFSCKNSNDEWFIHDINKLVTFVKKEKTEELFLLKKNIVIKLQRYGEVLDYIIMYDENNCSSFKCLNNTGIDCSILQQIFPEAQIFGIDSIQ